jgi:TonB-dependent SusC/RagA subfamily outer membrane receptor
MKKLIITLFTGLCLIGAVSAQRTAICSRMIDADKQPLVFIDSVESDLNILWINPDDIKSIDILKDSTAVAKYGEKAKNGVIIIRTKRDIEMIKLSELITQYSMSIKDKNLKVCKDKILVEDPDKILVSRSDIAKVEVITDNYWHTPLIAGPEEKFINIVMKRK